MRDERWMCIRKYDDIVTGRTPGAALDPRPGDPGAGALFPDPKAPAQVPGGSVHAYTIERRKRPYGGGEFNAWA